MSTVPNTLELATGSDYALTYMNMSHCARTLNMVESVKIYRNIGKYVSICLILCIWLNIPEK